VAIESYKDLDVWQVEMTFAQQSYLLTTPFPKDEMYGMAAQIRRAAVSIPANIAEGYGRDQTGSFVQFLRIAQGIGLVDQQTVAPIQELCERVSKMLRSLIRSLEARRATNQ
jgi:hypothetical protein